jgi:hypothetical protein
MVPLEKLREEADDDNYLESIENAELEVEDLANFIARSLIFNSLLLMMRLIARLYSA